VAALTTAAAPHDSARSSHGSQRGTIVVIVLDPLAVDEWIRMRAEPVGAIETVHERPWATVLRVPLADGIAWFKACAPVQAFEPRLTAELFARWPDRVAEVLGYDEERAWLLLAHAGQPVGTVGNPPEAWLTALPLYAEPQRGEAAHARDHLVHRVPDLRLATLPAGYQRLVQLDLPLERDETRQLRNFAPRFTELCDELAAYEVPETIQHDDLHHANLYARDSSVRVLDWGDASISHPFASLVVTFRFLEEFTKLAPGDPWFTRLRDAYLEPWGRDAGEAFALAVRVGTFALAIDIRQRVALAPDERPLFDTDFSIVLRRAVAQTLTQR
jgi:Phosphotransferase enzyme family